MTLTTRTREGSVGLTVPVPTPRPGKMVDKGPGSVESGLFFNPAMRFSRDLSVLVVEEWMHRHAERPRETDRPFRVYDGLAATGARALRLAAECRVPDGIRFEVHANDRDEDAVAVLKANAAENMLSERVLVTRDDFALALGRRARHYIDIDPYGSPAPFLDAAVSRLASRGLLAVTATDTAALTGSAPLPCRRRYDAEPWHGVGMHDAALRILAGAAVRAAMRHDIGLMPVLAHATDHYVRVYLAARGGAQRADAAREQLAWLVEDEDGTRRFVPLRNGPPAGVRRVAGPMWGGPLQDHALIAALQRRLEAHPQLARAATEGFLDLANQEATPALPIYGAKELSRALHGLAPRRDALIVALREAGHSATRTHTDAEALRTDADWADVVAVARAL